MCRRRRVIAALLATALSGTLAPPAPARAASAAVGVSVDGRKLSGAVAPGDASSVALSPLARALGWEVERRTRVVRLSGDDHVIELTAGSKLVREDGDVRAPLRTPLVERDGTFYVSALDAARLFGLQLTRDGDVVAFSHPDRLDQTSVIDEVVRPSPKPRPTSAPASQATATAAVHGTTDAGRLVVSVQRTGGVDVLQFDAQSQIGAVQTNVDASGVDHFATPNATVQVGGPVRGAVIGMMGDPLADDIINGGVFEGVELRRQDLRSEYFAGHRLADDLSEAGVTEGDPLTGASTLAVVYGPGESDLLARREKRWHAAWGDITAESIVGLHGEGVGADLRTTGQTFYESRLSFERGLPVGPNAQPITLDVGRHLSDVTTLAGGVATSPNGTLGPFAALSTRAGAVTGALSFANHAVTTSVSANVTNASLQAYAMTGVSPTLGVIGALAMRNAALELNATSSPGTRDASLALRSTGAGVGGIVGLGLDGQRFGPIVGLSLPLSHLFAIEGTVQATGPGGRTARLALAMNVPRAQPRGPRTIVATVHVDAGDAAVPPLQLLVDGTPVRTAASTTLLADVVPGTHTYAIESVDGTVGSPQKTLALDAAGSLTLPLWRERVVSGRVRVADPGSVPADVSLSGIVVTIEPGDASAVTDADGRFFFGRQPFPADARIAVDPDTLPTELRAADAVPLPDGAVDIALPGQTIETENFGPTHLTRGARRPPPARHG